jgi:hypothetical protein
MRAVPHGNLTFPSGEGSLVWHFYFIVPAGISSLFFPFPVAANAGCEKSQTIYVIKKMSIHNSLFCLFLQNCISQL